MRRWLVGAAVLVLVGAWAEVGQARGVLGSQQCAPGPFLTAPHGGRAFGRAFPSTGIVRMPPFHRAPSVIVVTPGASAPAFGPVFNDRPLIKPRPVQPKTIVLAPTPPGSLPEVVVVPRRRSPPVVVAMTRGPRIIEVPSRGSSITLAIDP